MLTGGHRYKFGYHYHSIESKYIMFRSASDRRELVPNIHGKMVMNTVKKNQSRSNFQRPFRAEGNPCSRKTSTALWIWSCRGTAVGPTKPNFGSNKFQHKIGVWPTAVGTSSQPSNVKSFTNRGCAAHAVTWKLRMRRRLFSYWGATFIG